MGLVTGLEHLQSSLYLRAPSGKGKEHEIQSKEQGDKRKEPERRNLKQTTQYLFCQGNNNVAVTLVFETVSCTI